MKKRKRIMILAALIMVCAVIAGAWAYFTDLAKITVKVQTSEMGITVDKTVFPAPPDMVPGDAQQFTYQIRNDNARAMKVKSELTICSEQPITDEVEWYLSDTEDGVFELPEQGESVTLPDGQRVKYESISEDRREIVFSISSGVLDGTEEVINAEVKREDNISFYLILAKNANNDFQDISCDLTADIYAIQYKHTDDLDLNKNDAENWGYIKSIVTAQQDDIT